jgi:hypothetical protein
MQRNFLILAVTLCFAACSKPLELPFVQKYQANPGDLFYLKADGQFVLLERRKALDVRVAPNADDRQAFADADKILISHRAEHKPGEFWGPGGQLPAPLEMSELTRPAVPIQVLAFSQDGTKLAGGSAEGLLWIWDLNNAQPPTQLQDAAEIQALAFSPDGKTLASGLGMHIVGTTLALNPGRVRLWRLADGMLLDHFSEIAVTGLAYAADGRLAAGLADGSLVIRPAAGGAASTIQASTSAVTSVAWHPAGSALASAHRDKLIRLWNPETGKLLATLASPIAENPLFPKGIERIAFSADGSRLAAAYADGEMRIWDSSALNPPKPK